jgi:hypothetical protein
MDAAHGPCHLAVGRIDDPRLDGFRKVRPHGQGPAPRVIDDVGAEKFKRVMMVSLDQSVYALQRNARTHKFLLERTYFKNVLRLSADHWLRLVLEISS